VPGTGNDIYRVSSWVPGTGNDIAGRAGAVPPAPGAPRWSSCAAAVRRRAPPGQPLRCPLWCLAPL